MLARIRTPGGRLDSLVVVERRTDDAGADQALSTIAARESPSTSLMVPSIAERLSKRAVIVALACAIPLHLYVDPVAGLAVRAAAALAFGVSLVCAKRWSRTALLVS